MRTQPSDVGPHEGHGAFYEPTSGTVGGVMVICLPQLPEYLRVACGYCVKENFRVVVASRSADELTTALPLVEKYLTRYRRVPVEEALLDDSERRH